MKNHLLTAAIAALFIPALSAAQTASDWTGEASLTGSKTTGNTETTDIGLGLKLAKTGEKWGHKFKALADYGRTDGVNNKQRFSIGYQIDRNINEHLYVYGNADYFNDDFGAFKEGYFVGTGLGYKVIQSDPLNWNIESGLGYRSQSEQDPSLITTKELALRGFSDFDYKFNDAVSVYNDSEIIYSSSDTYIWNEIGLTAQLMGNLAARASFRIDNHSNVPVGRKKTDTITRLGVVYSLK